MKALLRRIRSDAAHKCGALDRVNLYALADSLEYELYRVLDADDAAVELMALQVMNGIVARIMTYYDNVKLPRPVK
jgi:hypothetical protein